MLISNHLRWRPGDAGTPKLMYLNPTGSNPTGAVLSAARRQEIYDICSMYDILILEDDPYYFMQFREASQQTSQVLKTHRVHLEAIS